MEEVLAPDARTVVIRWRRPFPEAAMLTGTNGADRTTDFTPLPAHIVGTLNLQDRDTFLAHSYWTTDYVGAGPFRVDRWEPGAFVEAVAFDRHVLGRPRIDRIRLIWNPDANAALATLLAGGAQLPADDPLRFQQGQILKREWEPRGAGTVRYRPTFWRFTQFQFKPDYASPRAVLDPRVRRALNHAVDKEALNAGLFEGEGIMADTLMYSSISYFTALDRAVAKYPFDLRRSEQLMEEAGYRKGADGFYASPSEGRLNFELKVIQSAQSDAERAIMAAGFRSAGFDFEEAAFPPAQSNDQQALATFRSLFTTSGPGGEVALVNYTTANIMRPETRWQGRNRGGWSHAEYDRLVDAFQTTLDRNERNQQAVQALTLLSEDVGVMSLYFNLAVLAYPSELKGINIRSGDGEMTWNVHQWELS
jgi:peptide/nickel transport system substrate-binding protein